MLMASYPDFASHKKSIKNLFGNIERIEELRIGDSNVGKKTLEFLFVWLRSHILRSDKDGYA